MLTVKGWGHIPTHFKAFKKYVAIFFWQGLFGVIPYQVDTTTETADPVESLNNSGFCHG